MLASVLSYNFIRLGIKFVLQPIINPIEELKLWQLELLYVNSQIHRDESVSHRMVIACPVPCLNLELSNKQNLKETSVLKTFVICIISWLHNQTKLLDIFARVWLSISRHHLRCCDLGILRRPWSQELGHKWSRPHILIHGSQAFKIEKYTHS